MDQESLGGGKGKAALLAALLAVLPASLAFGNPYKGMAKELSRGAARDGVVRIAVLPFTPTDGSNPADGWNISERLITQLVRQGKVKTIERGLLRQVMEEHYLARTGIMDAATLRRLGSILAVDALVTGSFVTMGSEVAVNARLIHVETGVILAAVEETVTREWYDSSRAPEASARPSGPTIWAPPAPEDLQGLRDSVAEPACAGAADRVDDLERSILDVKARYWALQLQRGVSFLNLPQTPGTTITDSDLRWSLYERIHDYYKNGRIRPLTPAEVKDFVAKDGRAYEMYRDCGLRRS